MGYSSARESLTVFSISAKAISAVYPPEQDEETLVVFVSNDAYGTGVVRKSCSPLVKIFININNNIYVNYSKSLYYISFYSIDTNNKSLLFCCTYCSHASSILPGHTCLYFLGR